MSPAARRARTIAAGFCALLLAAPVAGAGHIRRKAQPAHEPEAPEDASHIKSVRFWTLGDLTRVAVEISAEFKYKSDRLPNPDRLFYDIEGAKPAFGGKGMFTIPVNDPMLKQIRMAETQPGTTRIVLDLGEGVQAQASVLSSPDRLIIELRRDSSDRSVPPPAASPASPTTTRRVFEPPARPRLALAQPKIDPPPPLRSTASVRMPAALREEPGAAPPPPVETRPARTLLSDALAKPEPSRELPRQVELARTDEAPRTTELPRSSDAAPLPAKRGSLGDRSLTRVLGLKLGRVVIDPGHGGHDTGTIGVNGLLEKDLVLDVSRRLGALIEQRLGSEVIYTRSDDTFIPLTERTAIANRGKADLFLSIHANSSPVPSASGIETYYLNFTTSQSALDVAARENAGSDRSIYELRDLLQQIALKDKLEESREFAAKVQTSMMNLATRTNSKAKDRGVRKAPFVVLIGASMPSVLVEIGFMSNPKDEAQMKKPEYRQKIAEALYKGVSQYAAGLSHFQVAAQRKSD